VMGLTVALVFAIGLFIATAPIVQFATQHRDEFFARTTTVSIFEKRDEPDIVKALWSNFTKHMLMFNVLGDRNGRHNLPNEPMLDPLMGTLAVLGFAYALWRWRDPANALMLLLFFIMNLGGILTVDFEAPQSLRSIGVMPALVYFATLPFALIAQELARVLRRPSSNVQPPTPSGAGRTASNLHFGLSDGSTALTAGLGFALVLAAIALSNFDTFFNKQKNSPEVWAAHSVAETIVAQQMQRLAPNNDLIVTALFANHPVLRFLAPDVTNYQQWTVNDRLPLARDASRGVAMLFDPLLAATFDAAQRYYPTASFGTFPPPTGGAPVVYEVVLAPKDLRAVQGLVARYFAGNNFEGAPIREEAIAALNVDWTQTQPVSGAFAAEFRGALYVATYGEYQLRVSGSPTATLFVDENSVSDAPMTLAKGNHALRVRVNGGATKVELQWQPPGTTQWQPVPPTVLYRAPVTNSGLLGAYYQSANWSGAPAFTQVDPEIALYFHNIPLPRPYSIEWKGKLFAPTAGVYRFATESIDNSQVAINSQIIVNNRGSTTAEGSIQLPQGWNDIGVRFADTTSHTHIYFYWTPPNGAREIVPSRYLSPPMGEYPSATEIAALPKPLPLPSQPIDPASQQPTNQPTPPPASNFTLRAVQTFGQHGSAPLQFNEPRAVAIDAQDHIVVADTGNRRVQILDSNGGFVQIIEGGEEKFVEPFDLVVSSEGVLVVLDSEQGWLYRFDTNGNSLGRIAGPSAQFFYPRGLSIDAQDNLYVADTGGSRIVKLSLDGQRLQIFGAKGVGKGQFVEPSDGAMDTSGFLFATDVPNKRIEMFNADGKFINDFPIPLAGPFNGPHLAFAPDQTLLVTAPESHKVQRYARD
ncbi:MAG: PA14 domain-containing protein, partial [Chloroflexota bacterium]